MKILLKFPPRAIFYSINSHLEQFSILINSNPISIFHPGQFPPGHLPSGHIPFSPGHFTSRAMFHPCNSHLEQFSTQEIPTHDDFHLNNSNQDNSNLRVVQVGVALEPKFFTQIRLNKSIAFTHRRFEKVKTCNRNTNQKCLKTN